MDLNKSLNCFLVYVEMTRINEMLQIDERITKDQKTKH